MKNTDAQVLALVAASKGALVGCETLFGAERRSMGALQRRGLVEVAGRRSPHWKLTPDGRAEVERLIADGRIVRP